MTSVIVDTRFPTRPAERPWYLDTVRPADRPGLDDLFAACSPESVRLRFFAQLPELPRGYLDSMLAGTPEVHDAVVARRGDGSGLAGLASLAVDRNAGPVGAELGVLVADAWQGRGIGAAMVDALLARARERGVERVSACVLPGRYELLAALSRRLVPECSFSDPGGLTRVYKLG